MPKYFLTNKAVDDLNDIWDYTIINWSEHQAEIYYLLLVDTFKELSFNPQKGKNYYLIEKDIFGFRIGEHIIFYKIFSEKEIEVVRILHGMMDIKSHL